jgi:hypothetical protein
MGDEADKGRPTPLEGRPLEMHPLREDDDLRDPTHRGKVVLEHYPDS